MVRDGKNRRCEPDVFEKRCHTPVFAAHTLFFFSSSSSSSSSTAAVAVATSAVRGPSEYQSIDLPFSIVFPSFTIPTTCLFAHELDSRRPTHIRKIEPLLKVIRWSCRDQYATNVIENGR